MSPKGRVVVPWRDTVSQTDTVLQGNAVPPWHLLRRVPGLRTGSAPRRLAPVCGGSVNRLWRVDTDRGQYALRWAASGTTALGVNRQRELRLHRLAADAGLAPQLRYAPPRGGLLVMDWVAGRAWNATRYAERAAMTRLGRAIARLQQITVPRGRHFDPVRVAHRYAVLGAAVAHRRSQAQRGRVAQRLAQVEAGAAAVAALALPPVIVHGDLGAGNVLGARRLWFIDWEYAQIASPCYEYGALLARHPRCVALLPRLPALRTLGEREYRHAVLAAGAVYAGLNALWHLARGPGLLAR